MLNSESALLTKQSSTIDLMETQQRLENIWLKLHMPEEKRLDMAIKYGSHHFVPRLQRVSLAHINLEIT